ncbi:MAG TPA: LacI family DNA-binding transcriptional regulator [Ruminiclostridium sp.]
MADKRINSHEIARIAGVSRSTVSRVINNINNVKPDTRERVLQIIKDYDYSPDFSAQMLAGKPSNTIGLFVSSNRMFSNKISVEDLLMDFMLARVIEIASEHDYFVLSRIIGDVNDISNQTKIREMFTQRRIDAGIFIGFPNFYSSIEEMVASGYVIGVLDQNIPGRNEPNRIVVNFDDDTMENAVNYLYGLGHRKIATIMGDPRRFNGQQKEQAFFRAMKKLGIVPKKEWIIRGNFNRYLAKLEIEKFLSRNKEMPTAILCANDDMAFGAMKALESFNIKIPDDVSVVGIDDSFLSRYYKPALTSFRVDFDDMLRILTENVIDCIQKPFTEPHRFTISSELIARESSRKI